MSSTNHGTQLITYSYYEEATQANWAKQKVGITPRGIYSGGYLTKNSNVSVSLSPLITEIGDANSQIKVQTTIDAILTSATLDSGDISSATPYIVLRWGYVASLVNYMEVHALASVANAQANDIIVGKCVFNGATLESFNYSERTFLNVQDLFLKVESTNVTELYVQLRAGKIQNITGYVLVPEQKVGPFTPPAYPNSRIDLVYVDIDGTAKILQGVATVTPVAPSYGGRVILAQIRLVNGDSSIQSSKITDVRSFLSSSSNRLENRTNDPSGAELTEGRIWLRTDL